MSDAADPKSPLWPPKPRRGRFDVVGLGEISIDEIGRATAPGSGDGKVHLASLVRQPGGTIATTVLGCARLGLSTALLGAVGDDEAAHEALAPLHEAGVELACVTEVPQTATRRAFIAVDGGSGRRRVYALRSARLDLDPRTLPADTIAQAGLVLLDVSDPRASEWAAEIAREEGVPVVLDADCLWEQPERLLANVDFPIVTEALARALSPRADAVEGLRELAAYGARLAVMTQGPQGSLALGPEGWIDTPASACRVADTTGAGDAFRAGFAWGLLRGEAAGAVLQAANAAGGHNCEHPGAQQGLATRTQLERRLLDPAPNPAEQS